jgi:hypothetical protein
VRVLIYTPGSLDAEFNSLSLSDSDKFLHESTCDLSQLSQQVLDFIPVILVD